MLAPNSGYAHLAADLEKLVAALSDYVCDRLRAVV